MSKKYSAAIFVSYAVLVAFLSLRTVDQSFVGRFDKVGHFFVYAIFAALAYRLGLSGRQYVAVCIGIVAYSGLLELGQSLVPGREMSALDLLANTLGVVLAALFCNWFLAPVDAAKVR